MLWAPQGLLLREGDVGDDHRHTRCARRLRWNSTTRSWLP